LTTLGWQIRGLDQVLEEIGEFESWKKLLDQKIAYYHHVFQLQPI
jgi:hypothetical protein